MRKKQTRPKRPTKIGQTTQGQINPDRNDSGPKQLHYANMSVQYTAIFHGCKNGNFQIKKCDIFLIFAHNIDQGYTLEPPQ